MRFGGNLDESEATVMSEEPEKVAFYLLEREHGLRPRGRPAA
jgi:hypothetical protein